MGTGQSQNPQGGQMGGMGRPGGIPGGGIASLAPQMAGQMSGFGQMVNQAVAQPGGMPMGGRTQSAMMGGMPAGAPLQTAQPIPLGGPGFGQGMQMGQPPAGFDAFMQQRQQQDAMNAQRATQAGAMPQFQAQMQQREMAMQGITQADIDRLRNLQMSGDPSFQAESDAFNARANANRMAALQGQFAAQGGMPGMGGPGMAPMQGSMPTQRTQQGMMDQIRQANPSFGRPPLRNQMGGQIPQGLAGMFRGFR